MSTIPSLKQYGLQVKNTTDTKKQDVSSPIKSCEQIKLKPQLTSDKVEFSNTQNKEIDKKKAIKIAIGVGALMGATVAGCVALSKVKNTEKIKKELSRMYDDIFENMQKEAQESGLNFEKPTLIFKKAAKNSLGSYTPNANTIVVNTRDLAKGWIKKDLSQLDSMVEGNKFKLNQPFGKEVISSAKSLYRKATQGEIIAKEGSTLYHELTHAKQLQYALSVEDGLDKMIAGIKKNNPNISDDELKKIYPFLFSYKPNKLYKSGTKFMEKIPKGGVMGAYLYKVDDIVNAFTNYNNSDMAKYYMNLAEISARNGESSYWNKLLNGTFAKPKGINDETIQGLYKAAANNVDILAQARKNISGK